MLLDKKSQQMLNLLRSSAPDGPRGSFSYGYICELCQMDEDEMFPIAKNLVSKDLAEYAYAVSPSGKRDIGISLSQNGIAYEELSRLEKKERWKERIAGFAFGLVSSGLLQALTIAF